MPTNFHHGVRVTEINDGTRPLRTVNTSIIGLVATADDADGATFPADTPVLVTDIAGVLDKAGTTGTLKNALTMISKQVRAAIVVVRVAEDADPAIQDTAVIGTTVAGARTGLQALLDAESLLGVQPRIIGAPGLETLATTGELATIAGKLNGMAYAAADAADRDAAVAYRSNFSARELMLIWPEAATGMIAAAALGLRAKIDNETGWHKSISNVGLSSVESIAMPVSFDLTDPATDAGILNENDVTTIIRREGFRLWGNRTTSSEPLFSFETATRTAQVIKDTISDGLFWAADKPLTAGLARDIVATINAKLRQMVAGGQLIGGEVWIDDAINPVSELKAGKLTIDYSFTPIPPLENLSLRQRITDKFFVDFSNQIAA